jgi:mono/diheme cytochrome c family protein
MSGVLKLSRLGASQGAKLQSRSVDLNQSLPDWKTDDFTGRIQEDMSVRPISITSITVGIAIGTVSVASAQGSEFGRIEFMNSCASCHGPGGKGDGPAIKSLIKPPPDLTKLSETNKGVFPLARVYEVIDGTIPIITHGTRDMPVWGQAYRRSMASAPEGMSKEIAESLVRVKVLALIEYISTLQGK